MAPKRKLSLAELGQRKLDIANEKVAVRQELKRLRSQERAAAKQENQPFTAYQKDVALTLFCLGGWRLEPAVDYLESVAPEDVELDLVETVETWALEAPLEKMLDMEKEGTAPKASVHKNAADYFLKWSLAQWVADQNDLGVTPSTAAVLRQRGRLAEAAGVPPARARRLADAALVRNRAWASRWRRSHAVGLGVPRVVDGLPLPASRSKALAAWQLHNYHAAQAAGRVVRLNLDETRVLFYVKSGVGNVAMRGGVARRARGGAARRRRPQQTASKGAQRAAMTHVGIVCDDPVLQGYLPQVFIANDKLLRARDVLATEANLPPFTCLIRGRSSWNSNAHMVTIVRLLGRALQARAPGAQFILSMDAVRLHLSAVVLKECARWGIRVVVVPAGLTWLLQPLDTHVFAQMKRAIRDAYQDRVGREGAMALATPGWVEVVTNTIYCFLRRGRWAHAFDHNGFGASQQLVSQRVLSALEWQTAPAVPSSEPSEAQVRALCPQGSRTDVRLLTRGRAGFILRIPVTPWLRARHEERRAGASAAPASSASPPYMLRFRARRASGAVAAPPSTAATGAAASSSSSTIPPP